VTPGGRLIESRVVERAATFVFQIDDRFFGTMTAYVADLKPVVTTVYATAALPEVLNYAGLTQEQGRIFRQAVTLDRTLNLTDPYNPRSLVGAASQVHRSAKPSVDKAVVWQRLQQHMVDARPPGLLDSQRTRTTSGAGVPLRTEELAELMFVSAKEP